MTNSIFREISCISDYLKKKKSFQENTDCLQNNITDKKIFRIKLKLFFAQEYIAN